MDFPFLHLSSPKRRCSKTTVQAKRRSQNSWKHLDVRASSRILKKTTQKLKCSTAPDLKNSSKVKKSDISSKHSTCPKTTQVAKGKENRNISLKCTSSKIGSKQLSENSITIPSSKHSWPEQCSTRGDQCKRRSKEEILSISKNSPLSISSSRSSDLVLGTALYLSNSPKLNSSSRLVCTNLLPAGSTDCLKVNSVIDDSVVLISNTSGSSVSNPANTPLTSLKTPVGSRSKFLFSAKKSNLQNTNPSKILVNNACHKTILLDTPTSDSDITKQNKGTNRCDKKSKIKSNPNINNAPTTSLNSPEFNALSLPIVLPAAKHKYVENWLHANDFSDSTSDIEPNERKPPPSASKSESQNYTSLDGQDKKDDFDLASSKQILDELYGREWHGLDVFSNKSKTDKIKHTRSRLLGEHCKTDFIKRKLNFTSTRHNSSSESEDLFEKFLKDVKHKNIPKNFTPALATPDFINDNSLDTSLTLYLNNPSKAVKVETERTLRYREPVVVSSSNSSCGGVNKRLHFSTSDESSDFSPFKKVKVKTTSRTQSKPTLPKRSEVTPSPKPVKPKKNALLKVAVGTVSAESTKDKKTNVPEKRHLKGKRNSTLHRGDAFPSQVRNFLASLSVPTPPARCDPLAKHYKKNFAKVKEELCSKLFKLYNEQVFDNQLPHDMSVTWNVRMKRTAGYCYNRRIVNSSGVKLRSSRIVLSTKVIGTPDRLRDTLIHEMCHAAAWVVDDVRDGHGPFWKKWAKRAIAQFPELPAIRRCHDYNIYTKFTYRCVNCAYSLGRHSKSLNLNTKRCGHCYGKFELLVNTKSKSGVVTQAVSTRRSPRGFARFVKENYGSVKKSQQGLKHGDVMKLLGQQFSALKMTQTP